MAVLDLCLSVCVFSRCFMACDSVMNGGFDVGSYCPIAAVGSPSHQLAYGHKRLSADSWLCIIRSVRLC